MSYATFEELEGTVLLCRQGTYVDARLFCRGNEIFVKCGAGYIRLNDNGRTSKKGVHWSDLRADFDVAYMMGHMILPPFKKRAA